MEKPPSDIKQRAVEIDNKRFELGPNSGKMTFFEIQDRLGQIKNGKNDYKILSGKEFNIITDNIKRIHSDQSLTKEQKEEKHKIYIESLGFTYDPALEYWTGSEHGKKGDDLAYVFNPALGEVLIENKHGKNLVFLVREI